MACVSFVASRRRRAKARSPAVESPALGDGTSLCRAVWIRSHCCSMSLSRPLTSLHILCRAMQCSCAAFSLLPQAQEAARYHPLRLQRLQGRLRRRLQVLRPTWPRVISDWLRINTRFYRLNCICNRQCRMSLHTAAATLQQSSQSCCEFYRRSCANCVKQLPYKVLLSCKHAVRTGPLPYSTLKAQLILCLNEDLVLPTLHFFCREFCKVDCLRHVR